MPLRTGTETAARFLLAVVFCFAVQAAAAQVVINEVCYDPVGDDTGYEWIELYNAGSQDVDLEGALLMSGGAIFQTVFEIPHYILRSGRFLLIGESQIPQAVFHTNLAFQNGGALTDGIRYVSPDGSYTDTVLYDAPNGGLPDDTGTEGTSFAPDVPAGWSLARILDGLDTDACAADFLAEQNPTPGTANHIYVDYALLHPHTWQEGDSWQLSLYVQNQSAIATPVPAELTVLLDGLLIQTESVASIAAGDSLHLVYSLPVSDTWNHELEVRLELTDDPDLSDNHLSLNLFQEHLMPPLINEVMYAPNTGRQEWIELWVRSDSLRGEYTLEDAAHNVAGFSLPDSAGYYVICSNPMQMLTEYIDCPAHAVVETTGWPALNNDGDSIFLYDGSGNLLDQLTYTGQASQQGKSLERYLDGDLGPAWRYSLASAGATPGQPNSQSTPPPAFSGTLKLTGSPFNPKSGENVSILYNLAAEANYLNCSVYDRAGHRVGVLADNLSIPKQGTVVWNGRDAGGKCLPRGLYVIVWESRASTGGKILRRQLSAALYD